jgi:hypothetical protein
MLPALVSPDLATQIEKILWHSDMAPLLKIIEQHNSQSREVPGRRLPRKDNFLLGPHLFQVLVSVQSRDELRQRLPVLDQPAAEVRNHLQKVAADCKALAALIRKGPQPHVVFAAATNANEALKVFVPWTELFEAADSSERQLVAFVELLERAGGWFDALADRARRAKQNRHTGNGARRMRAAEFLPGVFRRRLGQPYHDHVGTIATLVSRIETDADFVKKVETRQKRAHEER